MYTSKTKEIVIWDGFILQLSISERERELVTQVVIMKSKVN